MQRARMMKTVLDFRRVQPPDRDVPWLQGALQRAIELEFATIPPYLTAMWSIKAQNHPVAGELSDIVLQEMGHMGLACNLLNALCPPPGSPDVVPLIASSTVAAEYPRPLPGKVRPGLIVPLERISRPLVRRVFMAIEQPEYLPLGERAEDPPYPTIGAFYDAISDALLQLDPSQFAPRRQRGVPQVNVTPIESQLDALRAISLIKKQGEGTAIGPYFDPQHPGEATLAHYYRFGQIYHQHKVSIENFRVVYKGKKFPFPHAHEIYPMAPIPKGGYQTPLARKFDDVFSDMLRHLQAAWESNDDAEGDKELGLAIDDMGSLYSIALELMTTKIKPSHSATYGPAFVYRKPR